MKAICDLVKWNEEDQLRLKTSYATALQNSHFRDYVSLLPIHEDLLMKYTSRLEEASEEFSHCQSCPGVDQCQNKITGFVYTPKQVGKTIVFEYLACPYLQKKQKEEQYKANILLFDVPKAVQNASLRQVYADDKTRIEVIKYMKSFLDHYELEEKPKGIYLHGSFGTGKSYLIAALFNELAKKNVRSAMIYFPEFLRSLKESFDTDYRERFQMIKKIPLLLIDDIGAENLTPWARDEILSSILQYRMDEQLPTFFTSNLSIAQLEEHLSMTAGGVEKVKARRIIERIKQLTVEMDLISKNRRSS